MKDLASYLAKRKADYKFGIPLSYKYGNKMLFIYDQENSENSEFLKSIVEKGFKEKIKDHTFLAFTENNCELVLNEAAKDGEWRFVVIFGEELARNIPAGTGRTIVAPEISLVREKPEIKKHFWSSIKDL